MSVHNSSNPVENTIRSRRTSKVLLAVELREEQQACWNDEHAATLESIFGAAAWAPFHKKAHNIHLAGELKSPVPWRFHVVRPEACTELLQYLDSQAQQSSDPKWQRAWQSKIKEMISACGVLVQATWLPDPADDLSTEGLAEGLAEGPAEGHSHQTAIDQTAIALTRKNIEHIAAASSAVQNLLLAAESHHWLSYWSSGGILRDDEVFDHMKISRNEQLLGSIFLTPSAHPASRIIEGGLREQRGELADWVHWV